MSFQDNSIAIYDCFPQSNTSFHLLSSRVSLSLHFTILIGICTCVFSLAFFLLSVLQDSWICDSLSFINLGNFGHYLFKCLPFSPSNSGSSRNCMYAAVLHGISQFSETPFFFFFKVFYYSCILLLCVLLGSWWDL